MRYNQILTKDFLVEHHLVRRMTGLEIANLVGCTMAYVCMMMKTHGVTNMSNTFKRGVPNKSNTKFAKGNIPWNTGISIPSPNKGKVFPRGALHWNWKGGTPPGVRPTSSPEYKEWRNAVFCRDGYTCVHCGQKGGKLCADHILLWSLYPEHRFEVSNGRTLCHPCHVNTPTYGSKIRKYVESIRSATLT